MRSRFINVASVLLGCLVVILSVRLLLKHQFFILRREAFGEGPKWWVSTVVPLLGGIWLLVFGLIGLIDERRGMKSKSE
jgi:hypothetical protein